MNTLMVVATSAHLKEMRLKAPHLNLCTREDFFRRISALAFFDSSKTLGNDKLGVLVADAVASVEPAHLPFIREYSAVLREIYSSGHLPEEVLAHVTEHKKEVNPAFWHMLTVILEHLQTSAYLLSWQASYIAWQSLLRSKKLPLYLPPHIVFHNIVDFSPVQIKTLQRLCELGLNIEHSLTAATLPIVPLLIAASSSHLLKPLINHEHGKKFADLVANFLEQSTGPADQDLHLCAAENPGEEASFIASSISQLIQEHGINTTVALAFGQYNSSVELICDRLNDYGIVATKKSTLAEAPCTQLLFLLFDALLKNWPVEYILNIVSHPNYRAPLTSAEDYNRLWRLFRRANIRNDGEGELSPQGMYEKYLEQLKAHGQCTEEEFEFAASRVAFLFGIRQEVLTAATLHEFISATLLLVHKYLVVGEHDGGVQLIEYLESCSTILSSNSIGQQMSLSAFKRWLNETLKQLSWSAMPLSTGQVELVAIDKMWGRDFDVVVICDLRHGIIPRYNENKFLDGATKSRINHTMATEIFQEKDGVGSSVSAMEIIKFSGSCLAATKDLILTYSKNDEAGKELTESGFFKRIIQTISPKIDVLKGASTRLQSVVPQSEFDLNTLIEQCRTVEKREARLDNVQGNRCSSQTFAQRETFFNRDENTPATFNSFSFSLGEGAQAIFSRKLGLNKNHPLTATKLEAFAICRYRGFLQHVLGIYPEEELGHDAAPRVLGQLAHKVLQKYYQENMKANIVLQKFSQEQRRHLTNIFFTEVPNFMNKGKGGHKLALESRLNWLHNSLQKLVFYLSSYPPVDDVEALGFELEIGTASSIYEAAPIQMGPHTVYFGGIIDRVDEGAGRRVVIDYKMSSKISIQSKLRDTQFLVTHFQLPLYLRLLEHARPSGNVELGAYLASIKDAAISPILGIDKVPDIREIVTNDRLENGLAAAAYRVLQPLFDGFAPADSGPACLKCTFSRVCRVREHNGN